MEQEKPPARVDDTSIPDDARLLHGVHSSYVTFDSNMGRCRPSSAAFKKKPELSVSIELLLVAEGKTIDDLDAFPVFQGRGIVSISANLARTLNQVVVKDPHPEDPTTPPGHGLVCGQKPVALAEEIARKVPWIRSPNVDKDGKPCSGQEPRT